MKPPSRLFKYRNLTARTLDMLVEDKLYFANPITFNDPLDTRPSLENDVDNEELTRILRILIEKRTAEETRLRMKAMKLTGSKSENWIQKYSRTRAKRQIDDIKYMAEHPENNDYETGLRSLLWYHMESELLKGNVTGVVSLAQKGDCPLMWSHYGDQHRGICLGYSVPSESGENIQKVRYGGTRLVRASDLAAMLDGNSEVRDRVYESMFLRKAKKWSYEKEWRLFRGRGTQYSPLELEEVVFGMRCTNSIKYTVIKALENRESDEVLRDARTTENFQADEV